MKLTILGSGASIITKGRRSTSFAVETNNQTLLFEAGWGVPDALLDNNIDLQKVDHIFITHPDTDHLGSLMSMLQSIHVTNIFAPDKLRQKPLYLHGYPGFKKDYFELKRILYSAKENFPIEIFEYDNSSNQMGELSISSKKVPHSTKFQAVGFRLEAEKKIIAYSGDTGYDQAVTDLAKDADVAVLEMSLSPAWYRTHGQPKTHMWTGDCAQIGAKSNAKKLVLVHLRDDWSEKEVIEEIRKEYNGEVILSRDNIVISLD